MSWWTTCKTSLWLAFAAIVCGGSGSLVAGEPIVFGNAKPKGEPNREKVLDQNLFHFEKLSPATPVDLDGISTPILPSVDANPRKTKRQQDIEDEKKNWMFFDKDEHQRKAEDRNFMGIRDDDDLADLDKSKGRHDYTFSSFKDNNASRNPRQPGRAQDPQHKPDVNASNASDQDRGDGFDSKRESHSSAIVFGSADRLGGIRTGADLDLQSVLGGKAERDASKSALSLSDFLSSGQVDDSRERQARTESFKQLLMGPSSMSGLSDPINAHPDLTRQPLNPVLPSSPGGSGPRPGNDGFMPQRGFDQPNNPLNSFASPDLNSRPSGFGSPSPTPGPWKPTEVQWPRPRF